LVAKPEGQRPFLRPGRKWEDNIKLVFKQVVRDDEKKIMWLRTGISGRMLKIQCWNFWFKNK